MHSASYAPKHALGLGSCILLTESLPSMQESHGFDPQLFINHMWWCIALISAPRRPRQEVLKFKVILSYIEASYTCLGCGVQRIHVSCLSLSSVHPHLLPTGRGMSHQVFVEQKNNEIPALPSHIRHGYLVPGL